MLIYMFQNWTPGSKYDHATFGGCAIRDGPRSFENWPGVCVWCTGRWVKLSIYFRFSVCDEKVFFFCAISFKCPYYAFSDIAFHVVCNRAICECKRSANFQRAKCTTIGVIVSQKKSPILNCLKHAIRNATPYFLHKQDRLHRLQISISPNYILLWLPVNFGCLNVYFELPSKTVAVAQKGLVHVVVISRSYVVLCTVKVKICLHVLPKDVDSQWLQ